VEILSDELPEYYRPFSGAIDFPSGDSDFHTYDEMLTSLKDLEKENPSMVKVFSIGKSINGKEIWALKIGQQNVRNEEGSDAEVPEKKAIAYMGTHHAREHISTEIPILFAEELMKRYSTDSDIASLLNSIDVYIIPMVNPDGAMYDIEGSSYRWWRKNRRKNADNSFGVDLNRNYGYGWGTGGSSASPSSEIYKGASAFSEPETQSVRDFFIKQKNITVALSLHTFSELILYPWGGKSTGVGGQDEKLIKKMANDMARMNGYKPMQSSSLYIASGDTCDYLYGELKVYCFTFELSPSSMGEGGFYPGESLIPVVFEDNFKPMLYLANAAKNPLGILDEMEEELLP
jgi:carboxypeptidase T